MKLDDYFKKFSIKQVNFCRNHKISRMTIYNILKGKKPTLDVAVKIFKATDKQVTPSDLGLMS